MEKFIIIDLGTNTAIFSVAEVHATRLIITHETSITTRIGENISKCHCISETSLKRNVEALGTELTNLKQKYGVQKVYAFTTEGVRSADNADEVVKRLNNALNTKFDVVSGEEEARYTLLSVRNIIKNKGRDVAVCDIGGGSTEVNILEGNKLVLSKSLQLGVVRLRNAANLDLVRKELMPLKRNVDTLILCGGTGTVTAALLLGLKRYSPKLVEGFEIKRPELVELLNRLKKMTISEIRELLQADKDRADVIISGVVIMDAMFDVFDPKTFLITTYGPRHGYMIEKLKLGNKDVQIYTDTN